MIRPLFALLVVVPTLQPVHADVVFSDAAAAAKRGDYATAFPLFKESGGAGNVTAMLLAGHMYELGLGVPKDSSQAATWFRMAAERGDARGQVRLGMLLARGDGVKQDAKEAVGLFKSAADQGDPEAQLWLGLAYAQGFGVKKNGAEAEKSLRRSAEAGSAEAQYRLATIYDQSKVDERRRREAVTLLEAAAQSGHAKAQSALGRRFLRGDGVPQDYVHAYAWSNLAASRGEPDAARTRDALEKRMSKDHIAKVQELTRAFAAAKPQLHVDVPKEVRSEEAPQAKQVEAQRPRGDGTADDGTCQGYGFEPGTTDYATCRMRIDQARKEAEARRTAYDTERLRYEQADAEYRRRKELHDASRALMIFGAAMSGIGSTWDNRNPPPSPPASPAPPPSRFNYFLPGGRSGTCQINANVVDCR